MPPADKKQPNCRCGSSTEGSSPSCGDEAIDRACEGGLFPTQPRALESETGLKMTCDTHGLPLSASGGSGRPSLRLSRHLHAVRVAWKIYAVGRTLTDFWSGAAFKCANSRVASRCLRCYRAGLP